MKKNTFLLSSRITLLLGTVIFIIISVYLFFFSMRYKSYDLQLITQENQRTLYSLEASLDTVIENIDNYSKMLVADTTIQQVMRQGDLSSDASVQSTVIRKLYSILQFANYVDAIWLVDQKGEKLTVGANSNSYSSKELEEFQNLRTPYGSYHLIPFGSDEKGLSLVRSYNSTMNFFSLGIVGIDINYDRICEMFSTAIGPEETIVVFDEQGEIFCKSGDSVADDVLYEEYHSNTELTDRKVIDGHEYLITQITGKEGDWKIIRYMPVPSAFPNTEIVQYVITSIIIVGIVILICAVLISRMLTTPIKQLLSCMKKMQENQLVKVEAVPIFPEFAVLFEGYNKMVDRIEDLIASTIEKQKRIRQIELNEIQEQMKPHFLYNTLDSIQALALMGESQKVCQLVENMGDFYRKSVSGGREYITVSDEIRIVKDYIDIMKVRFEGTFESEVECQEEAMKYLIPKLILQPLVENSFQYGIRGRNKFGLLKVKACCEGERLHLQVWDNGPGISDEILKELSDGRKERKSMGLRGNIERLQLSYGDSFSYEINSEDGTGIHLYIGLTELNIASQED